MVQRLLPTFICVIILAATSLHAAQDDPIRRKLDAAKAAYDTQMSKYREDVDAWFNKEDKRARDLKPAEVPAQVNRVAAEKAAFDQNGTLPGRAPLLLKDKPKKERSTLEIAFNKAAGEYYKLNSNLEAKRVEEELQKFSNKSTHPPDAVSYEGMFYQAFPSQLTWKEAMKECERLGGRLACIDDEKQNKFVIELIGQQKIDAAWVGASDEKSEGNWIWVSGAPMKFKNWGVRQPNNKGDGEHYLLIIFNHNGQPDWKGKWSDQPNKSTEHAPGFVCEWVE